MILNCENWLSFYLGSFDKVGSKFRIDFGEKIEKLIPVQHASELT